MQGTRHGEHRGRPTVARQHVHTVAILVCWFYFSKSQQHPTASLSSSAHRGAAGEMKWRQECTRPLAGWGGGARGGPHPAKAPEAAGGGSGGGWAENGEST